MDYETLRHFADTWVLLALSLLFVGIVAFVLRPGAGAKYDETSKIPLNED
jgi:cytochrome c oxidase cbb3-type subunit 4